MFSCVVCAYTRIRFRWAACQLDALAKCGITHAGIRGVLESPPKTLDETYEKILCAIDDEHSEKVVKLLHWLAYSPRPLHIEELAEVVAVNVGSKPRIDSEARFLEPRDILTICSSLVTTETDITGIPYGQKVGGQIRLAHLSVRDYLTSERIRAREGAQYCVQDPRPRINRSDLSCVPSPF